MKIDLVNYFNRKKNVFSTPNINFLLPLKKYIPSTCWEHLRDNYLKHLNHMDRYVDIDDV